MQKTDARQSANAGESKLHFLDYWRVIRVRFGIVLLAFLLVVLTAAGVTWLMPKKYRSATTMEVRAPQDDPSAFNPNIKGTTAMDPMFLPTQTEIIRSHKVLDPVIASQGLMQAWQQEGASLPPEVAYGKLASMLDLKQRRGTQLVDLEVTSLKPEEAKTLATAVAQSYADVRRSRVIDPAIEMGEVMDAQVKDGRKKLADLEDAMAKFRADHPEVRVDSIIDTQGKGEDPFQGQINSRQSDVDKARAGIAGLRNQLDKVSQLKGEELMRALATLGLKDPTVESILPKYQETNSQEAAMLNSGLGPNHPSIKALRAAREIYTSQLSDAVSTIKNSLSIQLGIAQKTLDSLEKSLNNLRDDQLKNRGGSEEYRLMVDEQTRQKKIVDDEETALRVRKIDVKTPLNPVNILNPATLPTVPSSPKIALNMIIGVLLGLIVGVGLAFFIEYLDTSVKTMDDVETMLGVPVLAIVPKNIKLLHKQPTDVPDAEAYRILRTNIEFNRKSADANTISMVSGGPGEGKSTTLCNLAFTCAQGGYSVLIVDADLRRPTQHKLFEVNNSVGLTNYLTTNISLEDVILTTPVENLSLMPSGILPADAVGILNSQRMSDMIAELKTRYDIIFFDSPPILGVSDGAVLASEVDQSIIIVQHRRFPRAMLLRVKQAIQNVGGTVLGVVLNNVDLRHDPNYAYYTSYYEYYAIRTPKDVPAEAGKSGDKPQPVSAGVGAGSKGNSAEY